MEELEEHPKWSITGELRGIIAVCPLKQCIFHKGSNARIATDFGNSKTWLCLFTSLPRRCYLSAFLVELPFPALG